MPKKLDRHFLINNSPSFASVSSLFRLSWRLEDPYAILSSLIAYLSMVRRSAVIDDIQIQNVGWNRRTGDPAAFDISLAVLEGFECRWQAS